MSLEDFLNASYALMAEERQRIDPFKDLLTVAETVPSARSATTVKTTVAAQNERSYAALGAVMGGSKVKKPKAGK